MPLVTSKEMFEKAYKGGYAIGAFNVNNMEMIQAIVEAANECRSPVILQVSAGARKYANPVYLKHLVAAAVETTDIPIVMHLDHGADFDICKASIDGGFTSVMIDASSKPWEENIALTRKVVEYAHDHGVVVEAELGKLAGVEDDVHVAEDDALFTSPDEVEEFTSRTGVRSLPDERHRFFHHVLRHVLRASSGRTDPLFVRYLYPDRSDLRGQALPLRQ